VGFGPLFIYCGRKMTSNIEKLKEQVLNLIEKPIQAAGCDVAELVISQHRQNSTVRVFVYCDEGVNLERCSQISRILGNTIDGTDLFQSGYTLEVSSPGLDRPLQRAIDYRYRIGEMVKIQFAEAKKPVVMAKIVAVEDSNVVFENESGTFTESLANIERAKIVY
jgi:ribosome maturation factor RimP